MRFHQTITTATAATTATSRTRPWRACLRITTLAVTLATTTAWGCGGQGARGGEGGPPQEGREPGCDEAVAREVVQTFGERLKNVSLLAPDTIVAAEIRANYGGLVSKHLLDGWLFSPQTAPGREVSSPWPERIQIDSVRAEGAGSCRVDGMIVYLTSMEVTHGGVAALRPVRMLVQQVDGDGWVISSYEVTTPAAPPHNPAQTTPGATTPGTATPGTATPGTAAPGATPPDSNSAAAAAAVIRSYYAAIDNREYRRAYQLWGDSGRASGQSYDEFAAGFAETTSVQVEVGTPGRIEGAAGSRYVEVPVVIHAILESGERQTFQGTYTLRRTVVEGATPAQRRWSIYSAEIRRTG
jgi:hypothetical protein